MPFSFRKTLSFGPLRITLSAKGIGFSLGAGGVRVSQTPTGQRRLSATVPGTGLRYTQKLPDADETK